MVKTGYIGVQGFTTGGPKKGWLNNKVGKRPRGNCVERISPSKVWEKRAKRGEEGGLKKAQFKRRKRG